MDSPKRGQGRRVLKKFFALSMNNVLTKQINTLKSLRTRQKKESMTPTKAPFSASLIFTRFSTKEQTLFAKRMSFLVKAGVPLVECLSLVRSQTKSKAKKRVYDS